MEMGGTGTGVTIVTGRMRQGLPWGQGRWERGYHGNRRVEERGKGPCGMGATAVTRVCAEGVTMATGMSRTGITKVIRVCRMG